MPIQIYCFFGIHSRKRAALQVKHDELLSSLSTSHEPLHHESAHLQFPPVPAGGADVLL